MTKPASQTDRAHGAFAFTLVEVLVSMSILALLAMLIMQLINGAAQTATNAEKRIGSEAQARLIFERMATDFAGLASRPDVNFLFSKHSGNDEFYFFAEASGYFAPGTVSANPRMGSPYSLVGYRLNNGVGGGQRYELERAGRGLLWSDGGIASGASATQMVFLPLTIEDTFAGVLSDPYNNSSNLRPGGNSLVPQWDVIGDQVLRLEFCFMLADGSISDIPVAPAASPLQNRLNATAAPAANDDLTAGFGAGSRWYDTSHKIAYQCLSAGTGEAVWEPLGWADVRAVVVAIATLDTRSRLILQNPDLAGLVSDLPDFNAATTDPDTGKPILMATAWQKRIESGFSGLPPAAAGAVRAHQMVFYLNQRTLLTN